MENAYVLSATHSPGQERKKQTLQNAVTKTSECVMGWLLLALGLLLQKLYPMLEEAHKDRVQPVISVRLLLSV